MTLLAPAFLYAALAVAGAVVALHFLVTRQPPAGVLPTARFVPDLPATATARAARPSDLLLLILRVLLVLAAGLGLARPVLTPARRAEARVILVDVSRSVTDVAALREGARSVYREGDAVVVFDSSARPLAGRVRDSLSAITPSGRRGSLSAAFVAAMRAASSLRASADSLELVIVSPVAAEELDAATRSVRSIWPGGARLLRVGQREGATALPAQPLELRAASDDPMAITIARLRGDTAVGALVLRDTATATATPVAGRAIVHWPSQGRPRGSVTRASGDDVGAVVAGDAIVVARFARQWSFPPDSLREAQVIARWSDGEAAAAEWRRGSGCIRSVLVPVTPTGDLVIRSAFVELVRQLTGPCLGAGQGTPMEPAALAALSGTGGRVSRDRFEGRPDMHSWLAPWCLGFAIVLALVELLVRGRRRDGVVVASLSAREKAA
jgi:hypothetical protein